MNSSDSRVPVLSAYAEAKRALRLIVANRLVFTKLMAVPFIVGVFASLLVTITSVVIALLGDARQVIGFAPALTVGFALIALIGWLVKIPALVTWDRFIVLGPDSLPPLGYVYFRWGPREMRYLKTGVRLFGLIIAALAIPLGLLVLCWHAGLLSLAIALAVIGVPFACYAGGRLFSVLVSVSVDDYRGIAGEWERAKPVPWKALSAAFLASLPFAVMKVLATPLYAITLGLIDAALDLLIHAAPRTAMACVFKSLSTPTTVPLGAPAAPKSEAVPTPSEGQEVAH